MCVWFKKGQKVVIAVRERETQEESQRANLLILDGSIKLG